jgi:hypothetical protein
LEELLEGSAGRDIMVAGDKDGKQIRREKREGEARILSINQIIIKNT